MNCNSVMLLCISINQIVRNILCFMIKKTDIKYKNAITEIIEGLKGKVG